MGRQRQSLPQVALGKVRLMETLWEKLGEGACQGSSHPPNQPSVLSLLRKASSEVQRSSLQEDLVWVSRSARVSLGTAIKDNGITFYLLNLISSSAGCFPLLNHCKSNCLEIPSIDS